MSSMPSCGKGHPQYAGALNSRRAVGGPFGSNSKHISKKKKKNQFLEPSWEGRGVRASSAGPPSPGPPSPGPPSPGLPPQDPPSAGPPSPGPPKISFFVFPLPPQFSFFLPSLVGLLVEFWCFEGRDPQMCRWAPRRTKK